MATYLMIENPGVAPIEAFTLLGASTSANSTNKRKIGKFGSGSKNGISVALRYGLPPIVFAGKLRMEFGTRSQGVDTGIKTHNFNRVFVKYGGKDAEGKSKTSTEDLGWVLEYGASDWPNIEMALREFVSNAIDRAIDEGENDHRIKWVSDRLKRGESVEESSWLDELDEYRKTAEDYSNVTIDLVPESCVRAKDGSTRVFIPLDADLAEEDSTDAGRVENFYNNIEKWFLHFSEPELINQKIMPKAGHALRNLVKGQQTAVIYRCGVYVREVSPYEAQEALYDFNFLDSELEIDESRNVNDHTVKEAAGRAIANANAEELAAIMQAMIDGRKIWEHTFSSWNLRPQWDEPKELVIARKEKWQAAFQMVAGVGTVLATKDGRALAEQKGFNVIEASEGFVTAADLYGVATSDKVLSEDDKLGREIVDATPDAIMAVNAAWKLVKKHSMENGRERPAVKCFMTMMKNDGSLTRGFYRDDTVFINMSLTGIVTDEKHLSQDILAVALEEVGHHATGAADCVRPFQDWFINLCAKMMK